MDPKHLLFHEAISDDGTPLFKSQRDMAQQLVELRNGGFEKKEAENVRIFISQVLKPGLQTGSRPMSANLRRALPMLIAEKISDKEKADRKTDEILEAIDRNNNPDGYIRPSNGSPEWQSLVDASCDDSRRDVVIITEQPAETQQSKRADLLTQELLRRAVQGGSSFQSDMRYEFFITDHEQAEDALLGLVGSLRRARSELSEEKAIELIRSAIEREQINLYHLANPGIRTSMCFFDPLLPKQTLGFHLYYHGESEVSVAKISDHYVDHWRSEFYRPVFGKLDHKWQIHPIGNTKDFRQRNTRLSILSERSNFAKIA